MYYKLYHFYYKKRYSFEKKDYFLYHWAMNLDNFGPIHDHKTGKKIFIVTGLSGAGKSAVMHALEDFGFYCVDNLPVALISTFLKFIFQSNNSSEKIALGIDIRSGENFLDDFIKEIDWLRNLKISSCDVKVLFLKSSEGTLLKRFQETRRAHPLANGLSLEDAIKKEREILLPLMDVADITINTDNLNIHELRKLIKDSLLAIAQRELLLSFVSFGFKHGVPLESNIVCDLRFLPNPFFVHDIKHLDGRDERIKNYLFSQDIVNQYWDRMREFLKFSVEKYYEEGRFFATVAIGCTGGRHRSVAFVDKLAQEKWGNVRLVVLHRDVDKKEG